MIVCVSGCVAVTATMIFGGFLLATHLPGRREGEEREHADHHEAEDGQQAKRRVEENERARDEQVRQADRQEDLPTQLLNLDRKSTRLNSSHVVTSRMPSSA